MPKYKSVNTEESGDKEMSPIPSLHATPPINRIKSPFEVFDIISLISQFGGIKVMKELRLVSPIAKEGADSALKEKLPVTMNLLQHIQNNPFMRQLFTFSKDVLASDGSLSSGSRKLQINTNGIVALVCKPYFPQVIDLGPVPTYSSDRIEEGFTDPASPYFQFIQAIIKADIDSKSLGLFIWNPIHIIWDVFMGSRPLSLLGSIASYALFAFLITLTVPTRIFADAGCTGDVCLKRQIDCNDLKLFPVNGTWSGHAVSPLLNICARYNATCGIFSKDKSFQNEDQMMSMSCQHDPGLNIFFLAIFTYGLILLSNLVRMEDGQYDAFPKKPNSYVSKRDWNGAINFFKNPKGDDAAVVTINPAL